MAPLTTKIIAHRGASYDSPENTIEAMRLAWRQEADGVEIDLRLSRDGRAVVIHDASTTRTGGREKLVREQTLEELRELDMGAWRGRAWTGARLPTLEEAIDTLPPKGLLLIELKDGVDLVTPVVKAVRAAKKEPWQIMPISFSFAACRKIKRLLPDNPVQLLARDPAPWEGDREAVIRHALRAKLDGLNLHWRWPWDKDFREAALEAGLDLYAYTVDEPSVFRGLMSYGVKGVTTNRPAFIREALAEEGSGVILRH